MVYDNRQLSECNEGCSTDIEQSGLQRPTDSGYTVRRLTPTECARLQGFPDDWTDGVEINGRPMSDSAKYKLWGNGIALNCLIDMMMQMKLVLERDGSTGRR